MEVFRSKRHKDAMSVRKAKTRAKAEPLKSEAERFVEKQAEAMRRERKRSGEVEPAKLLSDALREKLAQVDAVTGMTIAEKLAERVVDAAFKGQKYDVKVVAEIVDIVEGKKFAAPPADGEFKGWTAEEKLAFAMTGRRPGEQSQNLLNTKDTKDTKESRS